MPSISEWLRENKEWFFSGAGLFILTVLFYFSKWFRRKINRHRSTEAGTLMVSGEYRWAKNDLPHKTEIFYPQPFIFIPNLLISFPEKKSRPRVRHYDVGSPQDHLPTYNLIQQRNDGFIIEIKRCGDYKPYFLWKARGVTRKKGR